MASTTLSVRLDTSAKEAISDYASVFGQSVSEFVRQAALQRIED